MKNNKVLIIVDGVPYSGKSDYIDEHFNPIECDLIDTKFLQKEYEHCESLIPDIIKKSMYSLTYNDKLIIKSVIMNGKYIDQIIRPLKEKFKNIKVEYVLIETDLDKIEDNIRASDNDGLEDIKLEYINNLKKDYQYANVQSKYIDKKTLIKNGVEVSESN
ncbi:MAG TPA: hypothetical protein DEP72_05110 [Clostridiales bacterium]|nr:MAG: hypothetical protein A2Y18_02260 [Clostridiales bacterium GWD2_32_19]HCC07520.1 hypothetical protein [Clostridiales bacterium]